MAYVTADGNYGSDEVVEFEYEELTDAQWETVAVLPDRDKFPYVISVLNGEDTSDWEL
jgi:hypothetical protein